MKSETIKSVTISGAVEGLIDEALLVRIVHEVGGVCGTVYGKNGKSHLKDRIRGYNEAARYSPWVILVDLNQDAECAPRLVETWIQNPAPYLCFRITIRKIESWLLADRESFSRFFSIPVSRIPDDPESETDPKQSIINLIRRSRSRQVREDMLPRTGSARSVGPAYTSRMIEFIQTGWLPRVASNSAPSLNRALRCIERLVGIFQNPDR